MEEIERTPGPWSVNTDTNYEGGKPGIIWGPFGPGHGAVCNMAPCVYPREFNAADAVLIASAPDLLASLKELLPHATRRIEELNKQMVGSLYPAINWAMIDRAEKIIAKLEGQ